MGSLVWWPQSLWCGVVVVVVVSGFGLGVWWGCCPASYPSTNVANQVPGNL